MAANNKGFHIRNPVSEHDNIKYARAHVRACARVKIRSPGNSRRRRQPNSLAGGTVSARLPGLLRN